MNKVRSNLFLIIAESTFKTNILSRLPAPLPMAAHFWSRACCEQCETWC